MMWKDSWNEDVASPGLWKSEIVGLVGIALIGAAFVVPGGKETVYVNWLMGFIATSCAIAMSGNRKWERPVAGAAAIWLFISGFVPSVLSGEMRMINEIAIGAVLVVSALAANVHLRDDIRHARPLTM
jgi:hypothetical protein